MPADVLSAQPGSFSKPWYIHPVVVHSTIWLLVALLYTLKLSHLQIIPDGQIWVSSLKIIASFAAGVLFMDFCLRLFPSARAAHYRIESLRRKLLLLFSTVFLGLFAEILYFKSVPLLWLLQGSEKNYTDFGLPSINGLFISMLLACGLVSFGLYILKGYRFYLLPDL